MTANISHMVKQNYMKNAHINTDKQHLENQLCVANQVRITVLKKTLAIKCETRGSCPEVDP